MKKEMNELMKFEEYKVEWVRGMVSGKEKDLDVKIVSEDVCELFKSDGKWGVFGNMSSIGLNSLFVNLGDGRRVEFSCSESLYISMRYPNDKTFCKEFGMVAGGTLKKKRRKMESEGVIVSREDFDDVMIDIMRWVLRVKLFYNRNTFGKMLKESGDKKIVEVCNRYDERSKIWGCGLFGKKSERGVIKGRNVLGKLLMELREEYRDNNWECNVVDSIDFKLGDSNILTLERLVV